MIRENGVEIIVVSLGANGASLITKNESCHLYAPGVPIKSTVGAGDSMLAGILYGLTLKLPLDEVLKWGVTCGTATTMNEGTTLFQFPQLGMIKN